ncbi:DEAD/DEAH box helicase [Actinoalloteichus caeruleus]|uniref:DEAD/DEAH box helicase n=1 Tax=Actinoalloteichus cyanogriseus TaxID=2893586 RepID=UPI003BB860FB
MSLPADELWRPVGGTIPRRQWMKITDPDALPAEVPGDTEFRVLLPADDRFTVLREKLAASSIPVRQVPYLLEQETIAEYQDARGRDRLTVISAECDLGRVGPARLVRTDGRSAEAAREAFDLLWHAHADTGPAAGTTVPVAELTPPEWARFLPFPTFNPAQAEAVPHVVDHDGHLMVVAPTGSGKTVIGMAAALRAILGQGRKAAWLVPQRSLTDELDQELQGWRGHGLRVERLSGEYSVDVGRVRDADLWVATTEKFEAICRTSSLREALDEVGCVIVDEIHLLGDQTRGPVLEALLARMRGDATALRLVGLSATVSNADQVATWLGARLVRIGWRPSRLTWQLPMIPISGDWAATDATRTRLAASITDRVTADGGSVLVFCGSKRSVRRTALIIAASRGARTDGVHPDDLERLHEVCLGAGVGLHYKGWDHRREAERGFRSRELSVLVATSTVAAGVNLPARAVVVRDTQVGFDEIDVATVQQMFGRAGRVGAGEDQGWAFLVVDETERPRWQGRLVAGNTVSSQIQSSLPDHVLAEAVQQRLSTVEEAEAWWVGTLAHHQGSRSLAPLRQALSFLVDGDFLTATTGSDGVERFTPTELGVLTARLMVSTTVGQQLRTALARAAVPGDADAAERVLVDTLAGVVPRLLNAPVSEDIKPTVARLLATGGRLDVTPDPEPRAGAGRGPLVTHTAYAQGDLARAVLLTVANSPRSFHPRARVIGGIPYPTMYAALEEAPRYLHWLGTQGQLGTVHPWVAIVAADLGRRVRWRRCQPSRGAGRLLWMVEQMATPVHAADGVPPLFRAATARGLTSPDWTSSGMPRNCRLDEADYAALLRDRATRVQVEELGDLVRATGPTGCVLATWAGRAFHLTPLHRGEAESHYPEGPVRHRGAAVFTWRGDYRALGWLADYDGFAPEADAD